MSGRAAAYVTRDGDGELWIGHEGGARWTNIARHLPEIYAVEVASLAVTA
jgi:hypothetical protein